MDEASPGELTRDGKIITFYSYKGGTGRTMAGINVAYLLADGQIEARKPAVLIMDWDLEAPGVPRYLPGVDRKHVGLIDFFVALKTRLEQQGGDELYANVVTASRGMAGTDFQGNLAGALDALVDLNPYVQHDAGDPQAGGRVAVISAGAEDEGYATRVTSFDWPGFFAKYPEIFAALRARLTRTFDYVVVDSRTGVTDSSGICSVLLPERLVCVFTPNRQSLEGGLDMVRRALVHRRTQSLDPRPLLVFPLPSRVELSEPTLREQWRADYQARFEELFRELYEDPDCDLTHYFNELKVHHRSDYAYGEKVAVLHERDEENSLTRIFRKLAVWLEADEVPWEGLPEVPRYSPGRPGMATTLPPGSRSLAELARAFAAQGTLLSEAKLKDALRWVNDAHYVYPLEWDLITKSMNHVLGGASAQTKRVTLHAKILAGALALTSLGLAAAAWGFTADRNAKDKIHQTQVDRLQETIADDKTQRSLLEQRVKEAEKDVSEREAAVAQQKKQLDEANRAVEDAQRAVEDAQGDKQALAKSLERARVEQARAQADSTAAAAQLKAAMEGKSFYDSRLLLAQREVSEAMSLATIARRDADSARLAAQQAQDESRQARLRAEQELQSSRKELSSCKDLLAEKAAQSDRCEAFNRSFVPQLVPQERLQQQQRR